MRDLSCVMQREERRNRQTDTSSPLHRGCQPPTHGKTVSIRSDSGMLHCQDRHEAQLLISDVGKGLTGAWTYNKKKYQVIESSFLDLSSLLIVEIPEKDKRSEEASLQNIVGSNTLLTLEARDNKQITICLLARSERVT